MPTIKFKIPFGLTLVIFPGGSIGFLVIFPLLGVLAAMILDLPLGAAIVAGLLSAIMVYLSGIFHNLGHAFIAHRVGHPMSGIKFAIPIAGSLYPKDEPELPRSIHVKRALGGPLFGTLAGLLLLPAALALWPQGGVWAWVFAVGAVYNLVLMGPGALLPLPGDFIETDGGTLRRLWREKQAEEKALGK